MATPLWVDGFEHGAGATGGNGVFDTFSAGASIVTTPVRTGARALQIAASASAPQCGYTIAAGSRVVTQTFYVRFATLPTADVQLAHFVSGVNGYLWFMNTNDKFGVSVTTTGQVEGGPVIVVDTWYRIVVEYDTSTATFQIRAKVDGGTEFVDTSAQTAADITAARLGPTTSATYTAFYDDWIISVTDGDYEDINTNWGEHKIESHIPSSDGTHNITTSGDFDSFTSTAFSNSTTNGNTFIGHRPMQRANTAEQVIRQDLGATTNYMEFGLENMSDNTRSVAGVRAYACHVESAASGASLGEARLLLSDDTEVLTTGSLSVINSTEDPGTTVTTRKRMTIAPAGGWNGTKVDGLKARVGFADNAPDVNFIDFMLEVASFTAGGTTTQQSLVLGATYTVVLQKQANKVLALGATFTAELQKQANKLFALGATYTVALQRQVSKILELGATYTVALQKQANKLLELVATYTPVLAALKVFQVALNLAATYTVSMTRQTSKLLVLGATYAVSLLRSISKNLEVAATYTVNVTKAVAKTFSTITVTYTPEIVKQVAKALSLGTTHVLELVGIITAPPPAPQVPHDLIVPRLVIIIRGAPREGQPFI